MYISELNIDIETRSSVDLKKCGVYKYAASPDFKIILFSYAYDDGPVITVDMFKDKIPFQVVCDLTDPRILKTAYNAAFEMVCLMAEFKIVLDASQWECTLVKCGMLGLPMNLAGVSKVLHLVTGKLGTGMALIKIFCIPCEPTEKNKFRRWNNPEHYPEKWIEFCEYNNTDVLAEKEIRKKIKWFKIPINEHRLWVLDQKINRLGVAVDLKLIHGAIKINAEYQQQLVQEAIEITGIKNVKSVAQIKKWLQKECIEADEDETFDSDGTLQAKALPKLIEKFDSEKIKRVLQIRQETSKTSITKYQSMLNAVMEDGRCRGTLQFCGANRTWRWAGRIIQPHNYPKNVIPDLDLAREAVKTGCTEIVKACFDSVSFTLSQLLRTAFVPQRGNEFIIDDYSSIEARVLAWLAGEEWVLEVFRGHGLIYETMASNMFHVPVESIDKKSPLRQRGKVAILACGYQGAVGALMKMGAIDMGIPETELPKIVVQYRQANPNIVQFWRTLEDAAINAIQTGEIIPVGKGIKMQHKRNCLFITLPSGRDLVYCNATFDGKIRYWGVNLGKWVQLDTYGGKLAENITQAVARDLLAEGLLNLDAHDYDIPLHIHDEALIEHPIGAAKLHTISKLMCPTIAWAEGLPFSAEGFVHHYYKKED